MFSYYLLTLYFFTFQLNMKKVMELHFNPYAIIQLYYQYSQINNIKIYLGVKFNQFSQYHIRQKLFIYLFAWRVIMINNSAI